MIAFVCFVGAPALHANAVTGIESKSLTIAQQFDISNATPLSAPVFEPYQEGPYDRVYAPIHDGQGNRLFSLRETGMVVTGDGLPVMDPDTSSIIVHDNESQEFVNGANRALSIFLDSRLDRLYLRSGGRYTTAINMDRDVFLINVNTQAGPMLIYAFRNRVQRSGWQNLNPGNWGRPEYRFYDMNGRVIDNQHIAELERANWWRIGLTFLNPLFMLATATTNGWHVPVVEILDRATLRELATTIQHATYHPWPGLQDELGRPVVTEDGREIRINPRTNQLTDFGGWAIFNRTSGLPVVFHDSDIITTSFQQQTVESGVLRDVITVQQMLENSMDFHMHIILTPFGSFDVPVFNHGTASSPDFRLTNGQSTDGITINHQPSEVLDGRSFSDWLRDARDRANQGIQIATIILVFLVAAIVIWFFRRK